MATTTIAWDDGTTDKITVEYTGAVGTSQMSVKSDANGTIKVRSKVLTLKNGMNTTLTVTQAARSRAYSVEYSKDYL